MTKSAFATALEDISLAVFVVGMVLTAIFAVLGETTISIFILSFIIVIGCVNVTLHLTTQKRTGDTEAQLRRRRILNVRDEKNWLKVR